MAEKKSFPPSYIQAGTTVELSLTDANLEFIGVDDPATLDFIEAMAELRMLRTKPFRPSDATFEYAERKVDKMWARLPHRIFQAIEQRHAEGRVIL